MSDWRLNSEEFIPSQKHLSRTFFNEEGLIHALSNNRIKKPGQYLYTVQNDSKYYRSRGFQKCPDRSLKD